MLTTDVLEKLKKIQQYAEKSTLNPIRKPSASNGASKIGIITTGISYLHVLEALKELNLDLPVLKLGFFILCQKIKFQNL